MSNVKMLLDVVESMRSLADSVEVLAQGIADGDNRKQISKALSEKNAAPNNTKEAAADVSDKADNSVKQPTRLELRELAGAIAHAGKKKEIKAMLTSFGVNSLPELPEGHFAEFYEGLMKLKEEM